MRWLHGQRGRDSADYALSVVLCLGGMEPDSSTSARTRTRAKVNVRPRPLANVKRLCMKHKTKQNKTRQSYCEKKCGFPERPARESISTFRTGRPRINQESILAGGRGGVQSLSML